MIRTPSPRLLLAIAMAVAAVGCQDAPPPPPSPDPVATDGPPSDGGQQPVAQGPAPAPAPPPATEAAPQTRPPEEPVRIVITAKTFPRELIDKLKLDDLVEVVLAKGGTTQGNLKVLRATEIAVMVQGTSIITRLRPDDVRDVKVLFREDGRLDVTGADEPGNDQEKWLDRYAARPVLEGQPPDLWGRRFETNVALPVVRPFTLTTYTFVARKGQGACFAPSAHRTTLREGDLVKLVGFVDGLEQRPGSPDRVIGEVQLYLLKRGGQVQAVYSPDLLHPTNLDRSAVQRFLEQEPVTLAAYKVGQDRRYVRIVRVPAKTARTYMLHLERTPERTAVRGWRAQSNPGLAEAEKAVRALYKAVGLTSDSDLETPVMFELRTTSATGGLRLLPFRKELGMD